MRHIALALVALLPACATTGAPEPSAQLPEVAPVRPAISPLAERRIEEARAAFRYASEHPQVQRYAPAELQAAAATLAEAERMAAHGQSSALIEQQAELAERRAHNALSAAQAREREAMAARAEAQRSQTERREADLRERLSQKEKEKTAAVELAAEVKRLENELADVRAKQTERGWILTLKNELLFDSGGATLKSGAERALDNLAQFLRRHPERDIAIEGFTDSLGSRELNQRLSERRALAVKDALVSRGIEPRRIEARGYGPSFPIASNATETGRQLNRRVEIVINPS